MPRLSDFVSPEAIVVPLAGATATAVLRELSTALAHAAGQEPADVEARLRAREDLGSTALGDGIALPHARAAVERTFGAVGISPTGVEFAASDGKPVHVFVALLSPERGDQHLRALGTVGREFAENSLYPDLRAAKTPAEVHAILQR